MAQENSPNDGWTTVSEPEVDETKIVFDTIGDEFIGVYLGSRTIENEDGKYTQLRFKVDDEFYFMNANYSLLKTYQKIRPGRTTRTVFTDEKDIGQESPLRVFRVDIKRN